MSAPPLGAAVATTLGDALSFSFGIFWEILWALILGCALSAVVQAVISKGEMRRLLRTTRRARSSLACGLGAASASCSYAAVALARSLFRKGAHFTAAMAFEFASTNRTSSSWPSPRCSSGGSCAPAGCRMLGIMNEPAPTADDHRH
jgi:hypothetical protein